MFVKTRNLKECDTLQLKKGLRAEQKCNIDRQVTAPENVAIFEYLGKTVTNQNPMHVDMESKLIRAMLDKIRSRILFYSCLVSENSGIEVHTTIILRDALYGS
jgi:hypothetical protein